MEKEIREQDKEKEKEFNLLCVSEHLRLIETRRGSIYCVFLNIWESLRLVETQFTVCFWTFETPWDPLRLDLLCVSEHLRLLETRWRPSKTDGDDVFWDSGRDWPSRGAIILNTQTISTSARRFSPKGGPLLPTQQIPLIYSFSFRNENFNPRIFPRQICVLEKRRVVGCRSWPGRRSHRWSSGVGCRLFVFYVRVSVVGHRCFVLGPVGHWSSVDDLRSVVVCHLRSVVSRLSSVVVCCQSWIGSWEIGSWEIGRRPLIVCHLSFVVVRRWLFLICVRRQSSVVCHQLSVRRW